MIISTALSGDAVLELLPCWEAEDIVLAVSSHLPKLCKVVFLP